MLLRFLLAAATIAVFIAAGSLLPARAASLETLLAELPEGGYDERAAVVTAIAGTGDDRAVALLEALAEGDLRQMKDGGQIVRVVREGRTHTAFDPLTGAEIGEISSRAASKIRVNNKLRRAIAAALGQLTLASPDRARRLAAAASVLKTGDPEQIEALDAALETETDPEVRTAFMDARAAAVLNAARPTAEKVAAIAQLAGRNDPQVLSIITAATTSDEPAVAAAAADALDRIEQARAAWGAVQNVWYGLSLGSVLMLAAIGLAISFGVMGVINMAHGELVMLGAYTTFAVQELIRSFAPGLFEVSLLIAAPLAFLVAGAVGVGIERGVCRYLHGRPLETLLATWGISLILQQTVRSIFGPTNQQVGNPDWMSGAFEIGQLTITWNRLWILLFALAVFALLLLILKRTPAGLQMRAVTQNRRMAEAMGIRSGWVDALTFGLGAGIAGLAGVALSQIDNVSPNLGQSYIVDSFMVVVFGGVGNLWGAFAGAFTLGIVNKFLEPYAGAVLAKVLVLVFIILFIQRRPRGLFALKGRAVES
ncbi:urea ABC transporter permease subunit UrtB [Paralimibaculum aggregatum]|uniref:Urea ABC transporter permease subunit UrtB n=1 Tax=Paralimibaculum aggregatum TaxID=3036245 RepID=A0ABQ6LLS9_9RHOB|nr:urea ABC transporter permease subunit UrtB [Limibaculum sp. NKW23]GMG84150.1 urea ABC transporter permease subunit UrtB [Limibaculum sp. NKW23]